MARIINWIKKMCRRQESPGEQLVKDILKECPEAVGPTGIIDLKKAADILDEKRVRTIEQMIVLKFKDKGDISLKQYLDFEGNPHTPEFYEENWNDYDCYTRGFCVIGETVYIFDEEAKRHLLTDQRKSWIEKFLDYVSDENNLIFTDCPRELTEEEKKNAVEFVKSVRERYPGEFENVRKRLEENENNLTFVTNKK